MLPAGQLRVDTLWTIVRMEVAVYTSVSANIAELAAITTPNKLEYCLRHDYSLIVENAPYSEAVANTQRICDYLDRFDLVWNCDADAVITNMTIPIHALSCLGPHVTVCEEHIVEWNGINCGSMVWRDTPPSRWLLREIARCRGEWESLPCQWQTWLGDSAEKLGDWLTIAPANAFNSCVWNRPANARDEVGGYWNQGDLVYHPCGVFPAAERLRWIRDALATKVQR